jgi:phosphoribosylamine-glycine ligase
MAAAGYPGSYNKGSIIRNIDAVRGAKVSHTGQLLQRQGLMVQSAVQPQLSLLHVQVFHAGTRLNECGDIVAVGGRVLGVTATGEDVAEAQRRAYEVRADAGTVQTIEAWLAGLAPTMNGMRRPWTPYAGIMASAGEI